MKKTLTILTTLSILLVVSMISALQLSHSNYQKTAPSKEKSQPGHVDKILYRNLLVDDSTSILLNNVTMKPDSNTNKSDFTVVSTQVSAASQPNLIAAKPNTPTILLICTGLVGLVGISRKKE